MKESYWAYFVVAFGVVIVIIMLLIQRMSTTNEEDFYLTKEVIESSMIDAVDYGTYRTSGNIVMSREKFVEVFLRRFSETVSNNKTYEVSFYDIYENPPKATVRIRAKAGATEVGGETFDVNLDTHFSGILETIYGINGTSTPQTPVEPTKNYSISFVTNCSGATGGQTSSVTATYNKPLPSISKTEPKCKGYSFAGWSNSSNYEEGTLYYYPNGSAAKQYYDVKDDLTLYGRWSKNPTEYQISFDKNCSGATGGQTSSVKAYYGSALPAINKNAPSCSNKKFVGWSNNKNYKNGEFYYDSNGNASKSSYDVEGNLTLYGAWINAGVKYSCNSDSHKLNGYICQYDPDILYTCKTDAKIEVTNVDVNCNSKCTGGFVKKSSTCKTTYTCNGKPSSSPTCSVPANVITKTNTTGCNNPAPTGYSSVPIENTCQYTCDGKPSSSSTCSVPATEKKTYKYPSCLNSCPSDYNEIYNSCEKKVTKTIRTCSCVKSEQAGVWDFTDCVWKNETSSKVPASDCSSSTPSCSKVSDNGNKKISCSSEQWYGTKICEKIEYSCSKGVPKGSKCEYSATVTGYKKYARTEYNCNGIGGDPKGTRCEFPATTTTVGAITCTKSSYSCIDVGGKSCETSKCCKIDQKSCGSWSPTVSSIKCPSGGTYNSSTKKCEYPANAR